MKRKYISLLLIFMMMLTLFAACSKKDESQKPSGDVYESAEGTVDENGDLVEQSGNGVTFKEEDEDAHLAFVGKEPEDLFGSWTATSDKAIYLYGNLDVTVNSDGTWTGNVTGEEIGGKWKKVGDHLHMDNELFSFDLAYESSGKLILIETGEDASFNTVMTKK